MIRVLFAPGLISQKTNTARLLKWNAFYNIDDRTIDLVVISLVIAQARSTQIKMSDTPFSTPDQQ